MSFRAAFFLSVFALAYMMPVHNMLLAKQDSRSVQCELSPYSGSWVSSEPTVSFLSKLSVTDRCKQAISGPVATNNPWAGDLGIRTKSTYREYVLRPSSTCSPFDCDWGRSIGRLAEKGKLKAHFRMFLSQRYIELTRKGHQMLISWRIKYYGKKKPDQFGETLMVRAK